MVRVHEATSSSLVTPTTVRLSRVGENQLSGSFSFAYILSLYPISQHLSRGYRKFVQWEGGQRSVVSPLPLSLSLFLFSLSLYLSLYLYLYLYLALHFDRVAVTSALHPCYNVTEGVFFLSPLFYLFLYLYIYIYLYIWVTFLEQFGYLRVTMLPG